MAAKRIEISADDATYYLLPGGQGEISRDGASIDDTIFGQVYKSALTGPITWGINANAVYKGFPGYAAKILKPGTSTAMSDEAMALVSGKTYRITATAKRAIDRATTVVVEDNAVDHTADVDHIDYLLGTVTFKSAYTVTGSVTITGNYFPMTVAIAKYTGFTLNMTAEALRTSDMPALQANSGYHTHSPGLKTVTLELPNVFLAADGWGDEVDDRQEWLIEINPDGTGWSGSIARGFFRLMSQRQSGNVGALEDENLRFELNVPYYASTPGLTSPFNWFHSTSPLSPIPTAIKTCLDRFLGDLPIYGKYLHDGVAGWKGAGVLTSLSLTAGMESVNTFAVNIQGSGQPTAA
jgi:hypothetical protein